MKGHLLAPEQVQVSLKDVYNCQEPFTAWALKTPRACPENLVVSANKKKKNHRQYSIVVVASAQIRLHSPQAWKTEKHKMCVKDVDIINMQIYLSMYRFLKGTLDTRICLHCRGTPPQRV